MTTQTAGSTANDNAQSITTINGYALSAGWTDGVERIRDLELAERLGYTRVENIRTLIVRLRRSGKLKDLHHLFKQGRRSDGMPARTSKEYWLTESQALKVIAKSETVVADAILDEVIEVFVAWRHGKLTLGTPSNGIAAELAALQRKLLTLESEIALLRGGCISRAQHDRMKADVALLAELEVAARRFATASAARSDIYRELREMTGWGGRAQPWRLAPAELVHPAGVVLRGRSMSVAREFKLLAADRQLRLPEVPREPPSLKAEAEKPGPKDPGETRH